MSRSRRRAWIAVLASVAAILVAAAAASAHVEEASGQYRVELGWGNEPARAGSDNFVQVEVANATGAPAAVPAGALTVEVSYGDRARTVPLVPTEEPGELRGELVPTLPGTYAFEVNGRVDGHAVSVRAVCGEQTFDCVESGGGVEFPVASPPATALAERIEREASRVEDAEDSADGARTIAIAALGLAALALATAVVVARRARGGGSGP